jgi:hypothetical protein
MNLDTLSRPLAACLGAALLATSPIASAVVAGRPGALFSGAGFSVEDGSKVGFDMDFRYNTSVAEVNSAELGYHSKAASDYGINRAYSKVTGGNLASDSLTAAVSAWADSFTVTGGSGDFTADVSVTLSGQFGPGTYAEAAYGLFAVTRDLYREILNGRDEFVFDLIVGGLPFPFGFREIIGLRTSSDDGDSEPGSFTATGQVEGTYGQPFYLFSVLTTKAGGDGEIDMFNTAVFGISGPTGSETITGSRTIYAPAVPEPGTYAMCAVGLALLLAARRRAGRPTA